MAGSPRTRTLAPGMEMSVVTPLGATCVSAAVASRAVVAYARASARITTVAMATAAALIATRVAGRTARHGSRKWAAYIRLGMLVGGVDEDDMWARWQKQLRAK